jgi:lipoprotein-releasing system permease protein
VSAGGWVFWVARHYIRRNKQGRSKGTNRLSVLGIATGVFALTIIISVMNGFQLGFIENILEISSYHVRIDNFPVDAKNNNDERFNKALNAVKSIPGVRAAVPFMESRGIISGERYTPQAVVVRGLEDNTLLMDKGMEAHISLLSGNFDIVDDDSILLGAELARRLSVHVGDTVTYLSITGLMPSQTNDEGNEDDTLTVKGIFRTEYYEYDLGWAFINIGKLKALEKNYNTVSLGVKIDNRWQDSTVLEKVKTILKDNNYTLDEANVNVTSWRDYNKAFYSALRTEKMFMFILVGLIFIVVSMNIYQSQRRLALEKREEIGLMRAQGASALQVRCVFACNGFFIGLTGAAGGMTLGLIIATHIPLFFTALETIVNTALVPINYIASLVVADKMSNGSFSFFSPTIFYIKEIPSRVIPHEVIMIFLFGFLSAVVSAWFASRKSLKIKPAEVLRYE